MYLKRISVMPLNITSTVGQSHLLIGSNAYKTSRHWYSTPYENHKMQLTMCLWNANEIYSLVASKENERTR